MEPVTFEIREISDETEVDEDIPDESQRPSTSASSRDEYNEIGYVEEMADMDDIPQIIEGGEFDQVAIVNVSSEGIPDERIETWTSSSAPEKGSARSFAVAKPGGSSMYIPSTSSISEPSSSSAPHDFSSTAPGGRPEYGMPSFLGYNEHHEGEYFYTGQRLVSPIGYAANETNPWAQRFSSQYAPYEVNKNSYMDLDMCKNTSSGDRAPSTDSLNIRTDEKMPAKGEISEQESNGDIDGSWSHQVTLFESFQPNEQVFNCVFYYHAFQIYPPQDNDNVPRYMSSYDTTVARESWSLSNEQNMPHTMENISNILSKL